MIDEMEPIVGRYIPVEVEGVAQRIYFEEAGNGAPVLLFHTAGADNRQWRHILNDPALTAQYRFIAPDIPWHGKSLPPEGWQQQEYLLTTETYLATVLAISKALHLDRPIYAGCSMGGGSHCNWPVTTPISLAASSRSRPRIFNPPGMTSIGSTDRMPMAAKWAQPWCRPT